MKGNIINLFGDRVSVNTGVKYSGLLEQFMAPFVSELDAIEYIEDVFEFAINAWNFGNIESILPDAEFEKTTELNNNPDVNIVLLRKMIDYKISNFKEYENFIVDYELDEEKLGGAPILRVTTQDKDSYLEGMMDSLGSEMNEDDFEENYINRSAIVLKPQQPFIDWVLNFKHEDIFDFEEDLKETSIYLVDDKINDIEKWLKKKFDKFFMLELEEWCVNKTKWPQNRSYKMFKLWFRVEVAEMIYDLEKRPVLKSE